MLDLTPLAPPVCDTSGKKVLLINPPWKIKAGNIWDSVASCYPSLGLAMIGSYLEHCGAEVKILDLRADAGNVSLFDALESPDFVGITSTTVNIFEAYRIAEYIRNLWPRTKIVLGGVHATIGAAEVLQNLFIDFVIRGEGERSMAKLVAGLPRDQIPGLSMRDGGDLWEHPGVDMIENLDEMPMPAYHLLPMDKYHPPLGGAMRTPSMSLFSARGCPGKCTFCNSAVTKRTRFRSPENVVHEIKHLMDVYGIREVSFYDDTFVANRTRVRQICELLLKHKIDVTWTCMSRINFADLETLQYMARAGCHMICYGVESADEAILKGMRKGIKLENVKKVVNWTRQAKIKSRLAFMFGNPGETVETMEKSVRFAIASDPDMVQFNITTPYPGTELYEWADSNGYLITKDWSQYDLYTVVMNLPTVSPQEIHRFYSYAHRKFYLRPIVFWREFKFYLKNPGGFFRSIPDIIDLVKTMFKNGSNGTTSAQKHPSRSEQSKTSTVTP